MWSLCLPIVFFRKPLGATTTSCRLWPLVLPYYLEPHPCGSTEYRIPTSWTTCSKQHVSLYSMYQKHSASDDSTEQNFRPCSSRPCYSSIEIAKHYTRRSSPHAFEQFLPAHGSMGDLTEYTVFQLLQWWVAISSVSTIPILSQTTVYSSLSFSERACHCQKFTPCIF